MKCSSVRSGSAVVLSFLLFTVPLIGNAHFQESTPKGEKPLDQKFIQMKKIYERSLRASRYASRVKAKYAKDPKTLNAAQLKYEAAKDKFDSWLTLLGLAILHKQKAAIQGEQFKTIADEADKSANEFEIYAEELTNQEEANPLTGQSARASRLGRSEAVFDTSAASSAVSATATAVMAPSPIPVVADIIVGIAFSIYKNIQDRKAGERQQFVTDMREAISWRDWAAIKSDPSIEAFPAPKASPSPPPKKTPTPTPH